MQCIYLDWNATTPIHPDVADAMRPFLGPGHYGNPSSSHAVGQQARHALQHARTQIATVLHVHPDEIVLCSCGTEANNLAIWGVVMQTHNNNSAPPHVISSVIEHPAVLEYLHFAAKQSWLVYDLVGVDSQGLIDPADVARLVRPTTRLVSIMHANNEMGAVQDIVGIAQAARNAHCSATDDATPPLLIHTDAAQSFGKIPWQPIYTQHVDMCTVVGHKIGAPKGIAALYVRRGVRLMPMLYGGGQEGGVRPGTENVMLAVGLGTAAHVATRDVQARMVQLGRLRERMVRRLERGVGKTPSGVSRRLVVHGPRDPDRRLPHVLFCTILPDVESAAVLRAVQDRVAASAGAACHGDNAAGVLSMMGADACVKLGAFRLSVGVGMTEDDVDRGVDALLLGICDVCGVTNDGANEM